MRGREGGEEEREEREGGRERGKKGRIKHSSLQMEEEEMEEEEEEEEVYYSELMYTMGLVLKFKVPALNSLYTIIVAGLHVEVCFISMGREEEEKRGRKRGRRIVRMERGRDS